MTQAMSRLCELRSALGPAADAGLVCEREGTLVASPRSVEEVAALLRFADASKLTTEIVGAGTKRGWRNPLKTDLVLEMAGLAGVREHSWQDMTATVGAGTCWAVMQRALSGHNQHVALDPLWADRATVGGIIATNDSGALRLKYGGLRDLIICMTIVLADGTIARSGGKVVKNVAGYDLHKLMTGACGTLGVITEVTFRLHPLPMHTRTWTVTSTTAEGAGELMLRVLDSQLSIQAMQLRATIQDYGVDVQLSTLPEVLGQQIEVLNSLARHVLEARSEFSEPSVTEHSGVFEAREQLFAEENGVVFKATMLPSAIANLSAEVVRAGGNAVTQATGIMFAQIGEEHAMDTLASLRASVAAAGDGSLTVLRAPDRLGSLRATTSRGDSRASELMQEIKRRFDPNEILNPGRLAGGK
jgi:glycolate oxidase FAD binding subunit